MSVRLASDFYDDGYIDGMLAERRRWREAIAALVDDLDEQDGGQDGVVVPLRHPVPHRTRRRTRHGGAR